MDDFIYLIALIAWVAFAFYRKSQKKSEAARKDQTRPQASDLPSPFPTMKEIFGDEPAVEVLPVPATPPATSDGMSPQLEETAFEKEYKRSGIRSVEEMAVPFMTVKSEIIDIQDVESEEENIEIKDWLRKIDLRRAVIYSEILNRPYV